MVAGKEVTPADATHTEQLKHYWADPGQPGADKLQWGTTGDFDRCLLELSKHVGPRVVPGLCANLHHRATGSWPGHAPGEQTGRH